MAKGAEFVLPNDKPADIFTSNDFTDEHRAVRDLISDFVNKELLTAEATDKIEHQKDYAFTRKLLRDLGELGLLGAEVPERFGGSNLDKITSTIINEYLGQQGSFACTTLAHKGIGTWPILFFGNEEQKQRYLLKIVSGEWISSYSLTEAGSGSDAGAAKTKAILSEDGTHYVMNGEKKFLTNGGFADIVIVFAQVPDVGLTAFIVEKTFPGVTVGKEEKKMGIRGSSTTELVLTDVKVPVANLLGKPGGGDGMKVALNVLNMGRFGLGAAGLGAAKLCLQESFKYSNERSQFGRPLVAFGLTKKRLARMKTLIAAIDAVVYRTAGLLEESISKVNPEDSRAILKAIEEYAVECSIVKIFCSEALWETTDHNVQSFGGYGFCEDYPAERHQRDARINRLFEGTNEINRLVIFSMLTKKAMKGELPLMQVIKQTQAELVEGAQPSSEDDLILRLLNELNAVKKAVLLASGATLQKYGTEIENHQVVIELISDCLIDLYVMDSMLAAVNKHRTSDGEVTLRAFFNKTLPKLELQIREIFNNVNEGDELRVALAAAKRLFRYRSESTETLINDVFATLQK